MQVVVRGLLTNYKSEGSGKVILLLHGWGDSLSTFDAISVVLNKKYRVVRLDLPGFGISETPKETYNLELFASFVQIFLQKLEIYEVYAIVGHSNGGALAVKGLSKGILTCQKVVLLAASGIRTDNKGRKKILRLAARATKSFTYFLPKKVQYKIKKKVYAIIGSDIFVAENMQETFKQVLSEDVVSDSNRIKENTLLIYGDNDTATPVRYGEAYAQQIKLSQLKIIKSAGHFLHRTHSKEVESLITDFLNKS